MTPQSITNRYIKLGDLRALLVEKFGAGNFKISERETSYEINVPELLTEESMDALRDIIERIRFENVNLEGRFFVPEAALFEAVSGPVVESALISLEIPIQEVGYLTNGVLRGGRKCFAILVLIGCGKVISSFFRRDFLLQSHPDDRLPYTTDALQPIFGGEATSLMIKRFHERQWEFAIPVMQRRVIFRKLDREVILPFLQEEPTGSGSTSRVWKVKLHPQCHQLPLESHTVIRKQIECRPSDEMAVFQKELENLSLLAHLEHPNIVQLYCSYIYRDTYNLVFALADGGSLEGLLNSEPNVNGLDSSQLLLALAELASAINATHNFTSEALDLDLAGCHHDLAPRNILLHGQSFLLADFGLSTFRNAEEDSLTNFKEVRGSYVAPECQILRDGQVHTEKIGRASDVWSFGCILSEVLTYMMLGSDGVAQFRDERKVQVSPEIEWFRFHEGPEKESPKVSLWLDRLQENGEPCSMRMVALIRKMLSLHPSYRPRSSEVLVVLRGICVLSLAGSVDQDLESADTTYRNIGHLLAKMRFRSWLLAFTELLDGDRDELGKLGFDFPQMIQALKEMQRLLEGGGEGAANTKHQPPSLLRYQHSRLVGALPVKYRSVAKERLVELVLERDDIEQLSGLSKAMAETGYEDIGILAAVKHLTALAKDCRLTEREELILDQRCIVLGEEVEIHNLAALKPTSECVLVEWLRYGEVWADEVIGRELRRRLTSVIGLFHADDTARIPGSLRCRGIFHDPSQPAFGVVYSLPSLGTQPVTLHWLLGKERSAYRPLLEYRFRLAREICQCIDRFHEVGWLHRNLHSMNVLFFPSKGAGPSTWAKEPRILGFADGREDQFDSYTHGPDKDKVLRNYQHPDYLARRQRYRREFDYYSVGMLLLEIGLWSTLSTITDSIHFQDVSDDDFRKKVISTRIPKLGVAMGTRYMEATRACLEGFATSKDISFKSLVTHQISLIE